MVLAAQDASSAAAMRAWSAVLTAGAAPAVVSAVASIPIMLVIGPRRHRGRHEGRYRATAPLRVTTEADACAILRDHPYLAEVVPCVLPDGSQGWWLPRSVADLVLALLPENTARLRRRLGESLLQLWAEALDRRRRGTGGRPGGPQATHSRAACRLTRAARWAARNARSGKGMSVGPSFSAESIYRISSW